MVCLHTEKCIAFHMLLSWLTGLHMSNSQQSMCISQLHSRNGRTEPSVDDVPKLQFVEQCFREALRLYSPVTGISRDAAYDTLLGGHRVYQGERTTAAASCWLMLSIRGLMMANDGEWLAFSALAYRKKHEET